jgi:hypothetical protein
MRSTTLKTPALRNQVRVCEAACGLGLSGPALLHREGLFWRRVGQVNAHCCITTACRRYKAVDMRSKLRRCLHRV